jgi:hypothetical protein
MDRMPFGRHKGLRLDTLPEDYLAWLRGLDDLREPLRSAIETEWSRRRGTRPSRGRLLPADAMPLADALITAGYRVLTKQYHPDLGGDPRQMTLLNLVVDHLRGTIRGAA